MNIEHYPEKKVFQTTVDGETARLMYHVTDGALDVRHTIVPDEISGRGIASALVKAAYDYALANGLVPVATCSYAVVWLERQERIMPEKERVHSKLILPSSDFSLSCFRF